MLTEEINKMLQSVEVGKIVQMSVPPDVLQRRGTGDHLAYLVLQDPRVFKVTQAWRDYQELKETKVILECRVPEETRETEVKWECLGFQASMAYLVIWDLLACLADLVWMVAMEQM